MSRSFSKFLNQNFKDRFFDEAEEFLNGRWRELDMYSSHVPEIKEVELTGVTIIRVHPAAESAMKIAFNVVLELEVEIRGDGEDEEDQKYPWLLVKCEGTLDDNFSSFEILCIAPYNSADAKFKRGSLSEDLVPTLSVEKLEQVAENILSRFYPEAFDGKLVEPTELAKRLQLPVICKNIKPDTQLLGEIFFAEADVTLYDALSALPETVHVTPGTIVVDPYTSVNKGFLAINTTIMHEIAHWMLHRWAFRFCECKSLRYCNTIADYPSKTELSEETIRTMERQANRLAPKLLMPKDVFKERANGLINLAESIEGKKDHRCQIMESVIDDLSEQFQASRQSVKFRLVELGVEEARGVYIYSDNDKVRAHGWKQGFLQYNETFTISEEEALRLSVSSMDLRQITSDGKYLFVDHHFVLNTPKYVQHSLEGSLELTDYALTHMDECCLVFTVESDQKNSNADIRIDFLLNRNDEEVSIRLSFNGKECASAKEEEDYFIRQMNETQELLCNIPRTRKNSLKYLIEYYKTTVTELAANIDRDRKSLERLLSGETKDPSRETIIKICLALHLPPVVSREFLSIMGISLNYAEDQSHFWIDYALNYKYAENHDVVFEFLRSKKVKI